MMTECSSQPANQSIHRELTWEGGDLGYEEHHEDDEELAPHEELLDLLGGVHEGVAPHGARELLCVLGHIPLLYRYAGIVQSFHVGEEGQTDEQDDEVNQREHLQHAVRERDSDEGHHDEQEHEDAGDD